MKIQAAVQHVLALIASVHHAVVRLEHDQQYSSYVYFFYRCTLCINRSNKSTVHVLCIHHTRRKYILTRSVSCDHADRVSVVYRSLLMSINSTTSISLLKTGILKHPDSVWIVYAE
jgi:hypothetical protein